MSLHIPGFFYFSLPLFLQKLECLGHKLFKCHHSNTKQKEDRPQIHHTLLMISFRKDNSNTNSFNVYS